MSPRPEGFDKGLTDNLPRLRLYARSLVRNNVSQVEDLVQATVLRALENAHMWRVGTNIRAWLFTIMHNTRVNEVRAAYRQGVPLTVGAAAPMPAPKRVDDDVLSFRKVVERLPGWVGEVLELAGEGFSYEEIKDHLGLDTVGTVRSRLSRARRMTRDRMMAA